ncbi:MAG TPA: preprotein translocase subunit YajC [Verrucomicrobiae bacterium]|nr:preprotein translocase subunit YajC [Verrucomicrobiae bacterium]
MTASFSTVLLAADAAAPQQSPTQNLWMMLGPALLVFMFIFMMSSQRKRTRQQEEMLKTLKSGDKVSTTSGIIGTIVTVKDRSVSIRSEDSKLEVLKSSVTEVLERKADPAEAKERKAEPAEAKS